MANPFNNEEDGVGAGRVALVVAEKKHQPSLMCHNGFTLLQNILGKQHNKTLPAAAKCWKQEGKKAGVDKSPLGFKAAVSDM